MKQLKDYINYYIGCPCVFYMADDDPEGYSMTLDYGTIKRWLDDQDETDIKLVLRRLEDMTEDEMIALLQSMVPDDMEDKPIDAEYCIEMFKNDGGNLVDADVAVGADYNCRCFNGLITIKRCGTICEYDETGDEQELVNAPRAYHYLLQQGFDLFGLIDAGLAVDAKTVTG